METAIQVHVIQLKAVIVKTQRGEAIRASRNKKAPPRKKYLRWTLQVNSRGKVGDRRRLFKAEEKA